MIKGIVAYDNNRAIGKNNELPWKLKDDLKHFKNVTKNSIVIMGRKTYESIGKPLSGRINIVLSKTLNVKHLDVLICRNKSEVLDKLSDYPYKDVFVIGGQQIYDLFEDEIQMMYVTEVKCDIKEPDAFFDINLDKYKIIDDKMYLRNEENEHRFVIYEIAKQKYIDYINFCDELIDSLDSWFYNHFFIKNYHPNSLSSDTERMLLSTFYKEKMPIPEAVISFQNAFMITMQKSLVLGDDGTITCDVRPSEFIIYQKLMEKEKETGEKYKLDGEIWFEDGRWKGEYEKIDR